MCGIVGYTGKQPAAPILLSGLEKLEYRGYDSAGIALLDGDEITVYKSKGRLKTLYDKLDGGTAYPALTGIGHTRWATHGKPSDENSHPHVSASGRFAVVHNGIIENYASLRRELQEKGVRFLSETDTEVIAHLLDEYDNGDFLETVRNTVLRLTGSYSLGILCASCPGTLAAVRNASPLIIGVSPSGVHIASDIPALLEHTRRILPLADFETALINENGAAVYDRTGKRVEKKEILVDWDVKSAERGGYAHFMLKEIMEQPRALEATLSPRLNDSGEVVLDGIRLTKEELSGLDRIFLVACGSAYHAGIVGKYVLERLTKIPTEADLASEFRYRYPLVSGKTLVIIISQSGETADSLAALREAKRQGARVLSIVNVVGSSIAAESDGVLYTWAGPEISVATTKGYSTQLIMLYLIALHIATKLGRLDSAALRSLLGALMKIPGQAEQLLSLAPQLSVLAKGYAHLEHAYFIGRNLDGAVALEASLKLKEISYIHSEAYAAGELKHGTISLIEEGTPVIALSCGERLFEKTMSNIREVKARGAKVLLITSEGNPDVSDEVDGVLTVPKTHELFMPSLEIVPLQLLGYYTALHRGCDIDKPRNLAKSVTVE